MSPKDFLRDCCPPLAWRSIRRVLRPPSDPKEHQIVFEGDYSSWAQALQVATGYSAPSILAKTKAAMLKVRNGEAAFERDSVPFDTMEHPFPLLAALLRAAANGQRLSVLDFGGSLGSTYYQCKNFLQPVRELRWSVVEQPAHVACGRSEFATEQLRFYETIENCISSEQPNVFLLSGVLHYLEEPYALLDQAIALACSHLIVDRTPFLRETGLRERLTVQHVPEWIYPASYPAWFLSKERFLSHVRNRYRLIAHFSALDHIPLENEAADYQGFVFELQSTR